MNNEKSSFKNFLGLGKKFGIIAGVAFLFFNLLISALVYRVLEIGVKGNYYDFGIKLTKVLSDRVFSPSQNAIKRFSSKDFKNIDKKLLIDINGKVAYNSYEDYIFDMDRCHIAKKSNYNYYRLWLSNFYNNLEYETNKIIKLLNKEA